MPAEFEFHQRNRDIHPPAFTPDYKTSVLRSPRIPLWSLQNSLSEVTGPRFTPNELGALDHDLLLNYAKDGEPIGERTIVHGHVLDENGRPVPGTLVEIWQANAGGRYRHPVDNHPSPIDPNFLGAGRTMTDENGNYNFVTIKPGAYPWRNHHNAWRPAHIHFSVFGPALVSRLITQMYFPDDPLFPFDPIFNSIPDEAARQRLISRFDMETTEPEWALGFKWDIVLRGRCATPFEERG
jgi:protocatechuate 3,4-dioxygenase beta subunit